MVHTVERAAPQNCLKSRDDVRHGFRLLSAQDEITEQGFTYIPAADMRSLTSATNAEMSDFPFFWDNMPLDEHMADGGKYRQRRFGVFDYDIEDKRLTPREGEHSFFQGEDINSLNGGVARKFAPLGPEFANSKLLHSIASSVVGCLPLKDGITKMRVNVHQFRISCGQGLTGLATPEGIHQDGHLFVSQHLINRSNIFGGVSGIYDRAKEPIKHVQLNSFLDSVLVNDTVVMHDVSPIQPREVDGRGVRDMLIIDYNMV